MGECAECIQCIVQCQCKYDLLCDSPSKSPDWVCNKDDQTKLKTCAMFNRFRQIEKQFEEGNLA